MATTNSLGGVGSGLDTQALITGLVGASQGPINALKDKQGQTQSAVSTLSDISSALAGFKSAVSALSTPSGVGSFTGTSSSSAIAITTSGTAQPASYSMNVKQLAHEQRTYSNTFSSPSTALGQTGMLSIQIGSGTATNISIDSSDTLDQVVTKINASGARVNASTFFDGTNYRLQVRGIDTGKDNAITFGEADGVSFGLTEAANTVQKAQNSVVSIDGFDVERSTNQVVGAITGVTLALTAQTTSPVDVSISQDAHSLETKMQAVVSAYNQVMIKVNTAAGHGTTKAPNPVLASNSTLRSIMNRLSSTLQTVVGTGAHNTLGSIGLSLQKDGSLSLDNTKLETALTSDPDSIAKIMAGSSGDGVMDQLSSTVDLFNQTGSGLLSQYQASMQDKIQGFTDRIASEQSRLDSYQALLQKQFAAMDTTVTSNNSDLNYLTQLYSIK